MALNKPAMQAVSGAEDTPVTFKVLSTSCQLRPGPDLDFFAIGLLRKGNTVRGFPFIVSGSSWVKLVDEDATIHVPDRARREDGVWLVQVHPKHGRLVQSQEEEVRYGQDPGSGRGPEAASAATKDAAAAGGPVEGGRGFGKAVELKISASYEEMLQVVWTISDAESGPPMVRDVTSSAIEMVIDTASGRPPAFGTDELLAASSAKLLKPAKGATVKRVECGTDLKATVSNMPDGRYFLISAVVTFDRRHKLRSRWIRAATLNAEGRDRSIGNTDPSGNVRGKCDGAGCVCKGFVAMGGWSLNSDPTVLCRRCGCANTIHAIAGRACQAGRNAPIEPVEVVMHELPREARDWDERERNLWRWSNGALHPREHPHALRKRQAGRESNGKWGRVSVVCPTMEERHMFHEQVWACFVNQTWPDKELIVIETYQTRSSDWFRKVAAEDNRLIYLRFRCGQTTELSIGAKRNIGQHIATGDFIANFDDDDIYAPSYLSTMIGAMYSHGAAFITLSSWYFFDINSGRFGFFDAVEWAKVKNMRDKDIDGWLWGYGFSYVHKLQPALDRKIDYPDQNMAEDISYIRAWKEGFGDVCAALHFDSNGIVLHTLHGRNTSNSFALREIPREEARDTDFADLPGCLDFYLKRFPRQEGPSKFIENEADDVSIQRRYRELQVHWLHGEFAVSCARGADTAEVVALCAEWLSMDPGEFSLYRSVPTCGFVSVVTHKEEDAAQQQQPENGAEYTAYDYYNPYEPILGTWVYGAKATEYVLSMTEDGQCQFEGPHSRVGKVSGRLRPVGHWLQAELKAPDGEKIGMIRLRFVGEAQKMISNYRSANRDEWGKDILAQRPAAGESADGELAVVASAVAVAEAAAQPQAKEAVDLPLQEFERVGSYVQELWLVITSEAQSYRFNPTHEGTTAASKAVREEKVQREGVAQGQEVQGGTAKADAESVEAERVQLVVHFDQSLNLREKLNVYRGCTIGDVKEQLARLDLTSTAKPGDFHLKWEGSRGAELHDDHRISGVLTELELLT